MIVSGGRNVLLIIPTLIVGNSITLVSGSSITMYFDWAKVLGAILLIFVLFVIARIVQIRVDFKGK